MSDAAPITETRYVTKRLHDRPDDSWTIDGAVASGAYATLRAVVAANDPADVQEQVKASGLRGRGGAGFPTGQKWSFLPADLFPRYLVVNADEGEPSTFKDRMLVERDPHQLVEGIAIAAFALRCNLAFVYLRGEFALGYERLTAAIADAKARGFLGQNLLQSGFDLEIVVHRGAGAYICGEETALLESLEGERGMPRIRPPFPAIAGLYAKPTVVNNVETLSTVPHIITMGGAEYAKLGVNRSTGTRIFSVSGHVNKPGNYEVELGVTFRQLIDDLAGGVTGGRKVKFFIPGGASSQWLTGSDEHLDAPLDMDFVQQTYGVMLGSGAVMVFDETTDPVLVAWRLAKFFAHESCGKCTPCREGTGWIEKVLYRMAHGEGAPSDLKMLLDVGDNISPGLNAPFSQTTICPLGPSAVSAVVSLDKFFRDEIQARLDQRRPQCGTRRPRRTVWIEHRRSEPHESDTVTVTIDGREVQATPGELLIKVAQQHGTYIPRFCWHERMKPVGMCRMCLVEVEGVRGFPPACTTTVTDGMVCNTQTDTVKKIQDGVLEFLLVNHPLDCPVCDRGGECPLQDQTLAFGPGESRFTEEKRHFEKPIEISEVVLLDRERCIQCARRTRFADEIAGDPLITFVDRGDRTEVLNFPDHPFASYFSGNTVQICPVGALTAKPYRFHARPWDLATTETSCTTCAVQCRGALQSSTDRLVRFLGVDSEPVNHGWLCDKGRYGFEYIHSEERVIEPLVRQGDDLVDTPWAEALDAAAATLERVKSMHGPGAIAVLGGARGSNEDAYAWARFAKGVLRTDHVDAQLGDGLPAEVVLGLPRAEIADCDRAAAIVLLGPDLKEELPVLHLRVRRAAVELGVPVIDFSVADAAPSAQTISLRPAPGEAGAVAERLVQAVGGSATKDAADDPVTRAAALLREREGTIVVVLGRASLAEPADATLRAAAALATLPNVKFLSALRRGNVHGALDLGLAPGVLPGRVALADGRDAVTAVWGGAPDARGLDATGILQAAAAGKIHALVLVGCDPLADFPDRALVRSAFEAVGDVIAVDAFLSESVQHADVVLPATLWGEKVGTATNLEGRVQRLGRKVSPPGSAMDDWRIASELALRLGSDFDLEHVDEVTDEIARVAPAFAEATAAMLRQARDGVVLPVAEHRDEIVWRAGGLTILADDGSGASWEPIRAAGDGAAAADEASAGQDGEADADATDAIAEPEPVPVPVATIPTLVWDRTFGSDAVPARDAYALRLVTGHTLYDGGRAVTSSPAIAGLVHDGGLRVSATDLARIGVSEGDTVKVTSARTSLELAVHVDDRLPAGVARLSFAAGGRGAADLIDVSEPVTDVRVETLR